jgi:hypothetical protein
MTEHRCLARIRHLPAVQAAAREVIARRSSTGVLPLKRDSCLTMAGHTEAAALVVAADRFRFQWP